MPGFSLWEAKIEKGEQLYVRQVMTMGEDVSHGVGLTSNVGDLMMIPVVMTVQAGQATKVGGSLVGSDGALAVPGDSGNIVI